MIKKNYKGENKEDLKYDFDTAKRNILNWISHIIRGVQQTEAKINAFAQLNEENGLWIRDWAQKVLPVMYRESQKEYFGKKGMLCRYRCILLQVKGTFNESCILYSNLSE